MGHQDSYHTPKQIKIERKGNPRPLRRGPLKKGERRKGVKARLDELISSKKRLEEYARWIVESQERQKKQPVTFFDKWHLKWFDEHLKKHTKLLSAALKDGIIDWALDWWVFKP